MSESDGDGRIPLAACTLPDTIALTRPVLELAERFQTAVPTGWIVVFSWHDGERIRASKDAPWVDKGPGVHIGAYRHSQNPDEAIYHAGSLRYAVLIRKEVVESQQQKRIAVDGSGSLILE